MTQTRQMKFQASLNYDPTRSRHSVNSVDTVLHCHHYATLYTQLADDATLFDGKSILRETSEHAFYNTLKAHYEAQGIQDPNERASVAKDYWAFSGMGDFEFAECNPNGGVST